MFSAAASLTWESVAFGSVNFDQHIAALARQQIRQAFHQRIIRKRPRLGKIRTSPAKRLI